MPCNQASQLGLEPPFPHEIWQCRPRLFQSDEFGPEFNSEIWNRPRPLPTRGLRLDASLLTPGFSALRSRLPGPRGITSAPRGCVRGDRPTPLTRLDPQQASALYNLGAALRRQGQLDEAIHHLRARLAIFGEDVPTQDELADALVSKGELAEAAKLYGLSLRADPTDQRAREALAALAARRRPGS